MPSTPPYRFERNRDAASLHDEFDKLGPGLGDAGSRLSRLLEAPAERRREEERVVLPSLLEDEEEDEIFKSAPETVVFDAEEDLDIPDFLKS